MKGKGLTHAHTHLFIQKNLYQHIHHAALQAALKGMSDIATCRVIVQKNTPNLPLSTLS